MRHGRRILNVAVGGLVLTALCGCAVGPVALEANRAQYNEVIRRTTNEQLLLNLVRLQYRETPLFLDVGSVSAQFEIGQTANVSGTLNEGPNPINPDQIGLGASLRYTEKPTITFTPLQGSDFVSQLLAPLSTDAIVLLSRSGWSVDRVLRLTVQTINGLDNASTASGPTPSQAPRYEEFARLTELLRELQKKGLLEIGFESRESELALPLSRDQCELTDVVAAKSQGYGLRPSADGEGLVLTYPSRTLVWRIPPEGAGSPEVAEIVELLGLLPGRSSYDIQVSVGGRPEMSIDRGQRTKINIATRSMMGAMFYLSQAVEIPESHRRKGVVTNTVRADGERFDWTLVTGDLLRIHARATPPIHAAVAVRHRGYWFYIEDTDLTSKSTFGLLAQMFAYQAGGVESVAPVLTLPIGG